MVERFGEGWQKRWGDLTKASRDPRGSAFGGGGYKHVPGQTGMYAQYIALGGPPEGIGTARILAGGKMAAYRAGVRMAGSPLKAPITYTSIRGGPPVFVPTESLKGGEAFMPLAGSPLARGVYGSSVASTISRITATGGTFLSGGGGVGQTGLDPAAAGLGAGTTGAGGLAALGGLGGGIGGIGGDISNIGSGIMDTAKSYAPLAIKIVLAVIGIKILMSILGGRK
jgi:hypothetical protein